ncbi:MAG: GTP-binding protein [Aristaeellaceae bacterium]
MRKTIGILAHVDAGKTTLSEQVLYRARAIRTLGRVDHQDTFLDTDPLERQRGITIFSGQACFELEGDTIYWLDTPGHVDFSTEMERSLSVMDYAVLVVSCAEGVQSHTETVWHLLERYHVPVLIFLNKIDRTGADQEAVIGQMRRRLSGDVVDIRALQQTGFMDEPLQEAVAERDEALLERLFSQGYDAELWLDTLSRQVRERKCFPVMAGAALAGTGVDSFLHLLARLTPTDMETRVSLPLTARCYRVRHERGGGRLCFLRLLTGTLRVKDELPGGQKVNELRIYHGSRYRSVDQAQAGDLVAIPGLEGIRPGDCPGTDAHNPFLLEPMMAADLIWDSKATPVFRMLEIMRMLEDEEPSLAISENSGSITVHMMGRIQLEVLRQQLKDRFGLEVSFGPARVLYKETIAAPSMGIGHYEPLRHYAEVHLRLVPANRGSGVRFVSRCHVDDLSLNWQRLIETHVLEKAHKGVLTGAPLTDVTVELLSGRAHLKHTEGGDFRQSTYRAIRNALMYADNVLLEPWCGFSLRAPSDLYGTLAGALTRLQAETEPPVYDGEDVLLAGEAPYALFAPWQEDFTAVTRGRGALRVWMSRYVPCRDQASLVTASGYNPLADDTPDSVFCSHGAGYTVAWDHVREHAHLPVERDQD